MTPTQEEIYYLRSTVGMLREYQSVLPDEFMLSLGSEALADNINWLDAYIAALEGRLQ